jgi:hypothetical protein
MPENYPRYSRYPSDRSLCRSPITAFIQSRERAGTNETQGETVQPRRDGVVCVRTTGTIYYLSMLHRSETLFNVNVIEFVFPRTVAVGLRPYPACIPTGCGDLLGSYYLVHFLLVRHLSLSLSLSLSLCLPTDTTSFLSFLGYVHARYRRVGGSLVLNGVVSSHDRLVLDEFEHPQHLSHLGPASWDEIRAPLHNLTDIVGT